MTRVQFSFNGLLVDGAYQGTDSGGWHGVVLSSADGTDEPDGQPGDLVHYHPDSCAGVLFYEAAS